MNPKNEQMVDIVLQFMIYLKDAPKGNSYSVVHTELYMEQETSYFCMEKTDQKGHRGSQRASSMPKRVLGSFNNLRASHTSLGSFNSVHSSKVDSSDTYGQ